MPPPSKEDQLVATLTRLIETGQLKAGDKLPSTRALMAEYGVSYTVVRPAMRRLIEAGLVESAPGRGRWVAQRSTEGKTDGAT
jgi:GntR family transcriptional repressor for pyruvate dehydrogenase complex